MTSRRTAQASGQRAPHCPGVCGSIFPSVRVHGELPSRLDFTARFWKSPCLGLIPFSCLLVKGKSVFDQILFSRRNPCNSPSGRGRSGWGTGLAAGGGVWVPPPAVPVPAVCPRWAGGRRALRLCRGGDTGLGGLPGRVRAQTVAPPACFPNTGQEAAAPASRGMGAEELCHLGTTSAQA